MDSPSEIPAMLFAVGDCGLLYPNTRPSREFSRTENRADKSEANQWKLVLARSHFKPISCRSTDGLTFPRAGFSYL